MIRIALFLILIVSGNLVFAGIANSSISSLEIKGRDTIPEMCTVLPGKEIDTMLVFTNPMTKTFPDPNPFENYWACYYEFYKPNDYAQLAVRMIKWSSKEDALSDFKMQAQSATNIIGIPPERIYSIADSAYFNYDMENTDFCNECGLVAIQGPFSIYISFKGQIETVTREGKKISALRLLSIMNGRIPELARARLKNTK